MNFRRWVVFTFLIHVLVIVVDKGGGLVLYLLCADRREQHGESGIIASLPFILGAIANLGLSSAMVYFVRRGRFTAQQGFETSMTVALVWGGFVAALSMLIVVFVLPAINVEWTCDPWLVAPCCLVVPLLLVSSYANSTQLATDHVKGYGVVHAATSVTFLPAFFAIFYWLGADVAKGHAPYAVSWGRLCSTFAVAVFAVWLVRGIVKVRLGVHREFLREGVRYGWKANLTSTLNYLNHRIDLFVLFALYAVPAGVFGKDADDIKNTQVALYSVAVTWAELVWHFPESMRDLFFSKVAGSSHEEARRLTPVLCRLGLWLSVVGATTIVLLIDPIMGTITSMAKGSSDVWFRDWSPMVTTALWVLVPGTVAYTVSKVLQADLGARDRLQTCVNAQLMVLATMLGLDAVLIPEHGAVGAAAASSIAYALATLYTLWEYGRQTGNSILTCVLIRGSDLRYVREIGGAVLAKLRWSKS